MLIKVPIKEVPLYQNPILINHPCDWATDLNITKEQIFQWIEQGNYCALELDEGQEKVALKESTPNIKLHVKTFCHVHPSSALVNLSTTCSNVL